MLGIDLGGTTVDAALVELSARIIDSVHLPTPQEPEAIVQAVLQAITQLLERAAARGAPLVGIGIACPGLVDRSGVVLRASNLRWQHLPLRERVQAAFGATTIVENDTNAAALAEKLYGGGIGAEHLVYVNLGTGVGAGFILGGELYRGGGDAGEIGHMQIERHGPRCACGRDGCLEALVGGWAIGARAEALARQAPDSPLGAVLRRTGAVTAKDVAAAAVHDAAAEQLLDDVAAHVGVAVGNLVRIFDPEVVILGGGVARSGMRFLARVRQEALGIAPTRPDRHWRLEISPLGKTSGLLGAASLVLQQHAPAHR